MTNWSKSARARCAGRDRVDAGLILTPASTLCAGQKVDSECVGSPATPGRRRRLTTLGAPYRGVDPVGPDQALEGTNDRPHGGDPDAPLRADRLHARLGGQDRTAAGTLGGPVGDDHPRGSAAGPLHELIRRPQLRIAAARSCAPTAPQAPGRAGPGGPPLARRLPQLLR